MARGDETIAVSPLTPSPVPRESEEVAHNETKRGITSLAASRKCEPVVPHYRVRFPCND